MFRNILQSLFGLSILSLVLSPLFLYPSGALVAQTDNSGAVLYASDGPTFTRYEVSVSGPSLTKKESVTLPGTVEYVWQHPDLRHIYVTWSVGQSASGAHGVTAFDVKPGTGELTQHGADVPLKYRPIHVSLDRDGTHMLIVYNNPPTITVFNLGADGSIGPEVAEPSKLDTGIYTHQVKVEPSNQAVIVIGRGNYDRQYDPGSIHIFKYKEGILTNLQTIAPGPNFNPRHLDFGKSGQWVYVSLEAQHMLLAYKLNADGSLSDAPAFSKDTLLDRAAIKPEDGEQTGTVHVSPNGRFVYTANRGTGTVPFQGKQVFAGGENNMAVFQINQATGEPTLVQNIDTHGIIPRTFALDPSGKILVAGNENMRLVRNGDSLTTVPANLALYRVQADGKLEFVRTYDVDDTSQANMFWMGIMPLPH